MNLQGEKIFNRQEDKGPYFLELTATLESMSYISAAQHVEAWLPLMNILTFNIVDI